METKLIGDDTRSRINGGEFWGDDSVRLLYCIENGEKIIAELEAERDELRAIVDGRTVAPTLAEMAAHSGEWLCDGETVTLYFSDDHDTMLRVSAASMDGSIGDDEAHDWIARKNHERACWIALDDGRPVAWPKVTP